MESTLEKVRPIFRAVAASVVPELQSAEPGHWDEIEAAVERALAERPATVRRQLASFLRLLEWWPVTRYGRRLTKLDPARRTVVLHLIEKHPLLVLRRGMWGVRTLVFLGYYTRADVAAFIGYRAHRDGWEARPGSARERPSVTPKDVGIVYKPPHA